MQELKLQWYLRNGGNIESLERQYSIHHKRHTRYPNLVLFKYNQIESPFSEAIVREARGIILDESNNWAVVSRAFDKFFNYGEGHAASIDWSTAVVQEKVDGSLCVLYPYADEWQVQTSGMPDASGEVNQAEGLTFKRYFWETAEKQGMLLPSKLHNGLANVCYIFELTGPNNRVVVPHTEAKLTCLGARDVATGEQIAPKWAAKVVNIPAVKEFKLQSWADLEATFSAMSPLQQEGYVVVDGSFNRVKVKHPGYVALHHAKDGMTEKAFTEIIRSGETSEVLAAFPEFRAMFDNIQFKYNDLLNQVAHDYIDLVGQYPLTDKAYALQAVTRRCPAALFAMRRGKTSSIREFFAGMRIDNLIDLLNRKVYP